MQKYNFVTIFKSSYSKTKFFFNFMEFLGKQSNCYDITFMVKESLKNVYNNPYKITTIIKIHIF